MLNVHAYNITGARHIISFVVRIYMYTVYPIILYPDDQSYHVSCPCVICTASNVRFLLQISEIY